MVELVTCRNQGLRSSRVFPIHHSSTTFDRSNSEKVLLVIHSAECLGFMGLLAADDFGFKTKSRLPKLTQTLLFIT